MPPLRTPSPKPDLVETSLCVYRGSILGSTFTSPLTAPSSNPIAPSPPLDQGKNRLWFTYASATSPTDTHSFSHAFSLTSGKFYAQRRIKYDPRTDPTILCEPLKFGILRKPTIPEDIAHWTTTEVVFDREDPEMNCHGWIFEALKAMVVEGWLAREDAEVGTDLVVEWILNAPDYQEE